MTKCLALRGLVEHLDEKIEQKFGLVRAKEKIHVRVDTKTIPRTNEFQRTRAV